GPHERRRHHDLIAEHEIVDHEMMAVDLPPPRLARRRLAENGEPIKMLAVLVEVLDELGEMVIEAHDVARHLVALRAEARREQRISRLALRQGHLVEADALTGETMHVRPIAPFVVFDRKAKPLAL